MNVNPNELQPGWYLCYNCGLKFSTHVDRHCLFDSTVWTPHEVVLRGMSDISGAVDPKHHNASVWDAYYKALENVMDLNDPPII